MANKRKTTTAIVAGVTAVALLLGGTFAWTSISQQAKNEAIVDINPGGRLHDDFNGTNKDVYVENFGDDLTGVDIFARVRLDQYFEVGQDAGKNKTETNRKVDVKLGTDINDTETWVTYKPVDDEGKYIAIGSEISANTNWKWQLGNDNDNKPIYLPTFNMNKDSLEADINGTYEGTVEDDIVHYDDYKKYEDGASYTGTEVHDWDEDTTEETAEKNNWDNGGIITDENLPIDSGDVLHKDTMLDEDGNEVAMAHTAKPISTTAEVITMEEWLELLNNDVEDDELGNFWVYDQDGWVYWANPIAPGATTGLLLDGISMSRTPDDNWYYGINVVGQFATAGDLSAFKNDESGITDDALKLLGKVTNIEDELSIAGPANVVVGETAKYTVKMTRAGVSLDEIPKVTWSVEPVADAQGVSLLGVSEVAGVSISDNGVVSVSDDVSNGTTFNVVATIEGSTARYKVTVGLPILTLYSGSTTQVLLEEGVYQSYKVVFSDSTAAPENFSMTGLKYIDSSSSSNLDKCSYDPATQVLTVYNNYGWGGLEAIFTSEGTDQTYKAEFLPLEPLKITVDATTGLGTGSLSWSNNPLYYGLKFVDTDGNEIDSLISEVALSGEYANGTTFEPFNGSSKNYLLVEDCEQYVAFTADYNGQKIEILAKYRTANLPVALPMKNMVTNESGVYTGTISDSFANNGGISSGCSAVYTIVKPDGELLTLRSKENVELTDGSAIILNNGTSYLALTDSNNTRTVSLEGVDSDGTIYTFEFNVVRSPIVDPVTELVPLDADNPDVWYTGATYSQVSKNDSYKSIDLYQYEDETIQMRFEYSFDVTLGFEELKDNHVRYWRVVGGGGSNVWHGTVSMETDSGILNVGPYLDISTSGTWKDFVDVETYITVAGEQILSDGWRVNLYNLYPVERGTAYDPSVFYYGRTINWEKTESLNSISDETSELTKYDFQNQKLLIGYNEESTRIAIKAYIDESGFYYEDAYLLPIDPIVDGGETVTLTATETAVWSTEDNRLIDFKSENGVVTFTVPDGGVAAQEETYELKVKDGDSERTVTVTRRADPIVVTYKTEQSEETLLERSMTIAPKYIVLDYNSSAVTDDDPNTQNVDFNAYYTNYGKVEFNGSDAQKITVKEWSIRDLSQYLEYVPGKGIVPTQHAIDNDYSLSNYVRVFVVATLEDGTTVEFGPVTIRQQ